MTTRRSILAGAGAVAGALASQKRLSPSAPSAKLPEDLLPPYPSLRQQAPSIDPLLKAKRLFMQGAENEMNKLIKTYDRQAEAVSFLKSTSSAYKQYRLRRLAEERDAVRVRFHLLRTGVGW